MAENNALLNIQRTAEQQAAQRQYENMLMSHSEDQRISRANASIQSILQAVRNMPNMLSQSFIKMAEGGLQQNEKFLSGEAGIDPRTGKPGNALWRAGELGGFLTDSMAGPFAVASPAAVAALSASGLARGRAGLMANIGTTRDAVAAPSRALKAEPGYVYHATNWDRANEIAETEKLRPHGPSYGTDQNVWPDGGVEKRSYWSRDPGVVWQFAPEGGAPVILRAKETSERFKRESTGDIFSRKPVPAEELEILTKDGWKPFLEVNPSLSEMTNIKPPSENINTVLDANFEQGRVIGNAVVPINDLKGGVRLTDSKEVERVKNLAAQMSGPDGYFSRIIVDAENNIIEGQHRFEAAKQLGYKNIPVIRLGEVTDGLPKAAIEAALTKLGLKKEQQRNVFDSVADMIANSGSASKARIDYEFPKGFEKYYEAALKAVEEAVKRKPKEA